MPPITKLEGESDHLW